MEGIWVGQVGQVQQAQVDHRLKVNLRHTTLPWCKHMLYFSQHLCLQETLASTVYNPGGQRFMPVLFIATFLAQNEYLAHSRYSAIAVSWQGLSQAGQCRQTCVPLTQSLPLCQNRVIRVIYELQHQCSYLKSTPFAHSISRALWRSWSLEDMGPLLTQLKP